MASNGYELSDTTTAAIVDLHNTFREMVANGTAQPQQPKAKRMLKLRYNESISQTAQEIADKCDFAHQPPSNSFGFDWIGQNLYAEFYSQKMNLSDEDVRRLSERAVKTWYSEIENYVYPTCVKEVCGHFTQLVNDYTRYVGCGVSQCDTLRTLNVKNAVLVVCNYAPGGNIIGVPPYVTGEQQCPQNYPKKTVYGLCDSA
ncbi:unnamed protein product [Soboliphyme baturini]|uniref:SCP domain-containing protein n=1 Tax=Soboliphyme baturini TaxID=241478 RepID=A0A183IME1_9BILA|nr:unnamed protein product [Soboliphyme baturini]